MAGGLFSCRQRRDGEQTRSGGGGAGRFLGRDPRGVTQAFGWPPGLWAPAWQACAPGHRRSQTAHRGAQREPQGEARRRGWWAERRQPGHVPERPVRGGTGEPSGLLRGERCREPPAHHTRPGRASGLPTETGWAAEMRTRCGHQLAGIRKGKMLLDIYASRSWAISSC